MPNFFCHIEISTTDLKKSEKFYGKLFNWKIKSADFPDYSSFETGKEPGGGLMKVDKINPRRRGDGLRPGG